MSPSDVLVSRRKQVCQTCTTDPSRPIMIELGAEWDKHIRSKSHRRFLREREDETHEDTVVKDEEVGEERTIGEVSTLSSSCIVQRARENSHSGIQIREDEKGMLLGSIGTEASRMHF